MCLYLAVSVLRCQFHKLVTVRKNYKYLGCTGTRFKNSGWNRSELQKVPAGTNGLIPELKVTLVGHTHLHVVTAK